MSIDSPKYLTDSLSIHICEQFLSLPVESMEFNWHGGEPTLCDPSVLRCALETQKKILQKKTILVSNKIQTNAMFLSPEWINLLKEFPVDVGISLDGIEQTNNRFRCAGGNNQSFSNVMKTVAHLREEHIHFGVLTVITDQLLQFADETYNFYSEKYFPCDFLPCFVKDSVKGVILPPTISPELFEVFLIKMFDRWISDLSPLECRYLDNLVSGFIGIKPSLCSFRHNCDHFFSVNTEGFLYPCELYMGEPGMLLGDLNNESIGDILSSSHVDAVFYKILAVTDMCKKCRWWPMCGGGCSYQKIPSDFGSNQGYFFCGTRKKIFSHIEQFLKQHWQLWNNTKMLSRRDV
jgi:uncharacterized protein